MGWILSWWQHMGANFSSLLSARFAQRLPQSTRRWPAQQIREEKVAFHLPHRSETSKKQAKRPPPKTPTSNKGNGGKQGQQPVDPSIPAFQDPLEHLSIPPSENNAGNPSSTRALRSRQKSNEVRNEIDCGENFQIVMLGMKNDVIVFLLETENDKFWVTRQAIFPTYAHKLCLFYEGHLKIRNSWYLFIPKYSKNS